MKERIGEKVEEQGSITKVTEYYSGKLPASDFPYARVSYQTGWSGIETVVRYTSVKSVITIPDGKTT